MPKRFGRILKPKFLSPHGDDLAHPLTVEPRPLDAFTAAPVYNATEISRVMAEMGRRGGQIGGKRRLETMTKAERRIVATKAAIARWKKTKKL